jgi:hypothetical protein
MTYLDCVKGLHTWKSLTPLIDLTDENPDIEDVKGIFKRSQQSVIVEFRRSSEFKVLRHGCLGYSFVQEITSRFG